jgi:ATP adenylyltransferase
MSERVWAPWRMQYILDPKAGGDCVLCGYAQVAPARDSLVLYQGRDAFVVLNRYPYTAGHLMVVPRRHVAALAELPAEEHAGFWELAREALGRLERAVRPEGVNLGMNLGRAAGAGIAEHLHVHLVPRWVGDNSFMPVVGDVRVMNEHLAASWDRLWPAFSDLEPAAPTGGRSAP